jgi:hypothetical protein
VASLTTPKFRLSYPHLFTPRAIKPGDPAKYQLTALFTDDPETPKGSSTIAEMKNAALACAYEKWGDTEATRKKIKSGAIKMPFIVPTEDQIEEGKYPEGTALVLRFNASDKSPPGVVDRFRGPDGKAVVITDADVIYAGCYARASVGVYAYDRPDAKGVTFPLNNVQKLGEGERFDGRRKAADEFEAMDDAPPEMDGAAAGMGLDDDPLA